MTIPTEKLMLLAMPLILTLSCYLVFKAVARRFQNSAFPTALAHILLDFAGLGARFYSKKPAPSPSENGVK